MWATLLSTVGGLLANHFANTQSQSNTSKSRQENFMYGEMAANAADERYRKQYLNFFSPKAQLKQLKEAGLSPSVMYQGGAGAGGATAPQGGGAGGIQAPHYPTSALEAAQIGLMQAQINNINEDTIAAEIENGMRKLNAQTFANRWNLLNNQTGYIFWNKETGNMTSLSDIANKAKDYNEFENAVLKHYGGDSDVFLSSEEGRKTLREIYEANKKFNNEITVLANSEQNAALMLKITNLLNSYDFAKKSAFAQLKQIESVIESAELTTEQKGAMNRLIDKMGDSTASDILLVLMMILGQYSHVNFSFGASQTQNIKKE